MLKIIGPDTLNSCLRSHPRSVRSKLISSSADPYDGPPRYQAEAVAGLERERYKEEDKAGSAAPPSFSLVGRPYEDTSRRPAPRPVNHVVGGDEQLTNGKNQFKVSIDRTNASSSSNGDQSEADRAVEGTPCNVTGEWCFLFFFG